MATMTASRVDEVLQPAIDAACREYLEATRGECEPRYSEVEPWAWTRLQNRLAKIARRASVLKAPARRTDTAEGSSPAGESGYEGEDGA